VPSDRPKRPQREALKRSGTLNPHPDSVTDPLFQTGDFFDAEDLVQVKYNQLRHSASRAPIITRLYQLNGVVPAGVPPGITLPVVVTVDGMSSPAVTMAIR
jgi:hypothetical protein